MSRIKIGHYPCGSVKHKYFKRTKHFNLHKIRRILRRNKVWSYDIYLDKNFKINITNNKI